MAVPGSDSDSDSGLEVAELARRGFDVVGVDYATEAEKLTEALLQSSGLKAQVVQADVLTWQPEQPLDAIYEQTCLCALHPDHWVAYAAALHRWLKPGGKLFALFMQQPRPEAAQGFVQGPPYHCDIHAQRALGMAQAAVSAGAASRLQRRAGRLPGRQITVRPAQAHHGLTGRPPAGLHEMRAFLRHV
ncbi:MAG: class I SAM-dependent methyltransferase [Candidatus Protistobacter heckmanni]|nr:class I SAM-dependent methyltransferase [Candidatus Protistobacter heckmanni]